MSAPTSPPPFAWEDLAQFKEHHRFPECYPENLRTFWAGSDDVHGLLKELLNSASQSIVLAMFGFDDDDLDGILRKKCLNERIYVQMSLDRSQSHGTHEKELLAKWPVDSVGTSISIGNSAHHAIMHLKLCVVDGLYVVTGSTNWSVSGQSLQDNELRLIRDPVVAHETRTKLDIIHNTQLAQMHRHFRGEPRQPWVSPDSWPGAEPGAEPKAP